MGRFLAGLRAAIEPNAVLTDPGDRRRARALTRLLVATVPLGLLSTLVQLFTVPNFQLTFVSNAVVVFLLGGLSWLARGKHYRWAAFLAMVLVIIACTVAGLNNREDPVWWAYMMIAVLAGTLLLNLRGAAVLAALGGVAIVVVEVVQQQPLSHLLPPLMFHVVMSPLLLIVAHHRNALEEERRHALKVNQRLLEQAQEVAHMGHFQSTPGSEDVTLSPSLQALLDVNHESMPRSPFLARFRRWDGQRLQALLDEPPTSPVVFDVEFVDGRGNPRVAAVHVAAQASDADDTGPGLVGTVQDLTARAQEERQKAALREQLEEARRLETVGRIAGGVAHDFNNLLTVVVTAADLLRQAPDREEREALLADLDLVADRGSTLVRQLLAYARRQTLEPTSLDLGEVVREMSPILTRLASGGLEVAVCDEPVAVLADRSQIEQVVLNLVLNAADALDVGGTITVSVHLDEVGPEGSTLAARRCAVVRVRDDGPGMADDVRAHIFEPFFTTKGERGGTGLGLSTVYGVVHQSGGFVDVESAPGQGATFSVFLPAQTVAKKTDAPTPAAVPKATAAGLAGDTRPTVLVIDDTEPVLRSTTRLLERNGFVVDAAAGPDEARTRWANRDQPYDVVISDLVMPQTSGADLLSQFLEDDPAVGAILMSGYTGELLQSRQQLLERCVFLDKPFTNSELVASVQEALAGRQTVGTPPRAVADHVSAS